MVSASSKFRYLAHVAGIVIPCLCGAQQRGGTVAPRSVLPVSGLTHVVMTGVEIRRRNILTLDQLFQGTAPDVMASGSATAMSTTLRSRGIASPLTWAMPRVYLNGVELDSPGSLREIAPEIVDSVVVLPGAVAGTFAGAGASGGIVQVYTRRGTDGPFSISGKLTGGVDKSLYGTGSNPFREYLLAASGGREGTTYYLAGGTSSEDEWAPSYSDRVRHGIASLTTTGRYGTLTGFWRRQRDIATPPSDRLPTGSPPPTGTLAEIDTAQHTTYGAVADFILASAWTVHASGGVHRTESGAGQRQIGSGLFDTTVTNVHQTARRTSYLATTTVQLSPGSRFGPSITAGFDQSSFVNSAEFESYISPTSGSTSQSRTDGTRRGYFAAFGIRYSDILVLNAGARRDTKFGATSIENPKWYPRVDAALSTATLIGRFTVRGGVGRIVTPVGTYVSTSPSTPFPSGPATTALEDVNATEVGIDYSNTLGALGVTVYDQRGRNGTVIVPISIPTSGFISLDAGKIQNRGLSAYTRATRGPLAFRAEYSVVQPRFDAILTGVPLALVNDLPNAMGHAALTYTVDSASISIDARYAGAHHANDALVPVSGGRTYPAFLTYDVNTSHPFGRDGSLIVFIHNLLNTEEYDDTNFFYVRGRRFGIGVRFGTN